MASPEAKYQLAGALVLQYRDEAIIQIIHNFILHDPLYLKLISANYHQPFTIQEYINLHFLYLFLFLFLPQAFEKILKQQKG